MAVCGVDWPELDAIWVSHFHMDHVGGLGPLFAGTKHAPELQHRRKPMTIYGPVGIGRIFDGISSARDYKLREQPFPLSVVEFDAGERFEIVSGVTAVAMKTPHTPESHAVRITDGGSSVMYSADTGFDDKVANFGAGVDLMILECSFVRDKPNKKHLVLTEAIDLINKAKPQHAMLTHFYPEWDDVDFGEEVSRLSPCCEVDQAEDGLAIEITAN